MPAIASTPLLGQGNDLFLSLLSRLVHAVAAPAWVRAGTGLAIGAAAVLLRVGLHPLLGGFLPWVTSFVATLLAAVTGGRVAAFVTIVVCAASGSLLGTVHLPILAAFIVNSSVVAIAGVALREAFIRLRDRDHELSDRVLGLTKLHEFATAVVGSLHEESLLRTLLRAILELQRAPRGFISLFDEAHNRLVPGVAEGLPEPIFRLLADNEVAEGAAACGTCAALRRPIVVEDVDVDPSCAEKLHVMRAAGIRAVWSTPLLTRGGHLLGVVTMHFDEKRRPSPREVQLVDLYVRIAADAIDTAALLARAEHARADAEQAVARLRDVDRKKDEFLAMLGHELRNPLAPVRSVLDLARLRGEGLGERQLRLIDRQTASLARIVDDLLDVARITQGKIELRREPMQVASLVARTVDVVSDLMRERRHTLTVAVPPEPLWVNGDPTRLEQVLVNVLGNAAKYTPPGGHVHVGVERAGAVVRIRVHDDGEGISPELLGVVFNLFEQNARRLDRREGGLGIGLTIARRLVEMHEGRVWAESPGLGLGSAFIVELPIVDAPRPRAPVPAPALPRAAAGGEEQRVLVVDDNVDAAATLAELVEEVGFEVAVAYSGPEAVATAASFKPDLVFLDIGLPGFDGYEVARRLRAAGMPSSSLVAMTGYGQSSDRERARDAGFGRHFVKPMQVEALLELLEATKRAVPPPEAGELRAPPM